jgi:hypothetical protein
MAQEDVPAPAAQARGAFLKLTLINKGLPGLSEGNKGWQEEKAAYQRSFRGFFPQFFPQRGGGNFTRFRLAVSVAHRELNLLRCNRKNLAWRGSCTWL